MCSEVGVEKPVRLVFGTGRYGVSLLIELAKRVHAAGRKSRQQTEAERIRKLIENSIKRDLAEEYRAREHGWDVGQIGQRAAESTEPAIQRQRLQQAVEYYRELEEALDEAIRKVQRIRNELDSQSAGTEVFRRRQHDLHEARARAAARL